MFTPLDSSHVAPLHKALTLYGLGFFENLQAGEGVTSRPAVKKE